MSTDSATLPCLVRMPQPFEVQQQYYEEKDCREIICAAEASTGLSRNQYI